MIVVATDAPLSHRNLERLAKRAFLGIARTGGFASNGSGDYVLAFSTNPANRIPYQSNERSLEKTELRNAAMTPLFLAAVEATEEAIFNSLFMAEDTQGIKGRISKALPIEQTLEILRKHNAMD